MSEREVLDELKRTRDELTKELERIACDPEVLEAAEEFHKRVSTLTWRDLWQRIGE